MMHLQPIERLAFPATPSDIAALAELLCDAVNSGSAVSFLAPLAPETARAWWHDQIKNADPKSIFLVARDGVEIAGTVQLHASWAPNQPHRADIAKLIVHRRARGQGIGKKLMEAIEQESAQLGFTLLVLDTRRGCEAESLYRKLGWTEAGIIPNFALNADGSGYHDTVIFFKDLASVGAERR
jgi:acetyltransferase